MPYDHRKVRGIRLSANTRCVLLFARPAGREGAAKGLRRATALFRRLTRRVSEAARSLSGVQLLVASEPGQRGGSFGERLANAVADARAAGFREVVIVPGDVPALSARQIVAALRETDRGAAVLGPSPDGGVYLIGLPPGQDLPSPVRWCGPETRSDLESALAAALVEVSTLAPLADVDSATDLLRLSRDPRLPGEVRSLIRRALEPPPAARPAGERVRPLPMRLLLSPRAPPLAA